MMCAVFHPAAVTSLARRCPQMRMETGFSIRRWNAASHCAASAPSSTRWSAESVTVIILENIIRTDDRPLLGRSDSEDARVGRIQDRRELARAVHPEVRHRERATLELVLLDPARARPIGEGADRGAQFAERHPVDSAHDGCEKPPVDRNGYRDLHRGELPRRVWHPDGVGFGDLA